MVSKLFHYEVVRFYFAKNLIPTVEYGSSNPYPYFLPITGRRFSCKTETRKRAENESRGGATNCLTLCCYRHLRPLLVTILLHHVLVRNILFESSWNHKNSQHFQSVFGSRKFWVQFWNGPSFLANMDLHQKCGFCCE